MKRIALALLLSTSSLFAQHSAAISGSGKISGQSQFGVPRTVAQLMGLTDFNQSGGESANYFDAGQFTFSQFSQETSVPNPAADTCTAFYNNQFYVIGGYGATSTTYLTYVQIYNPQTREWSQGTPMTTGEWGAGCAVYSGKIYLFGGATPSTGQSGTTVAFVYDISGNSWSSLTALPTACADGTMAITVGSYIYVMWEGNFWQFDPSAAGGMGSYTALAAAPSPGQVQWAATGYVNVSGDDRLYFIGGSTGSSSGYTNVNYYYSITNSLWSSAQSTAPYSAHGQIQQAVFNGSIYYLGGYDGSRFYQTLYAYDPATDTWSSSLGTMNAFRDGVSGGFYGTSLYAIGGRNAGDGESPFGIAANESFQIGSTPVVQSFTKIRLFLSGTPSGSIRMGIYSDAGSSGPGSLILDAGAVVAQPGWNTITGLNLTLTPGTRYWLTFLLSGSAAIDFTQGLSSNPSGPGASPHCFNSQSYGALPGTFPQSGINCTGVSGIFAEQVTVN